MPKINILAPKISVIIPTYNRDRFIKEAIDSVLIQDFQDYEIIVIDDGSTDNTKEIVKSLKNKKIRYFFQKNQGRSKARNRAIKLARGQYLAFLDSDDVFLPGKLTKQVKCLDEHPKIGMVYASALTMDENGRKLRKKYRATSSGLIYKEVAFTIPLLIILPTVMVRKGIIDRMGGFDERMHSFEDVDLWRRLSKKFPVMAISKPLCTVRSHVDILREPPQQLLKTIDYYVKKIFSQEKELDWFYKRRAASYLYFGYYNTVRINKNRRKLSYPFLARSFAYWPLGPIIYTIFSLSYKLFLILIPQPKSRQKMRNFFKKLSKNVDYV